MKPLIGVTAIPERVHTSFAELPHETLPENYLELLERAGAGVVILPVHHASAELIDRLDGLMLSGGGDVHPERYGAVATGRLDDLDHLRDEFELAAVRRAVARDVPVLAVCRGIQVMNVAMGGTLIPDLPGELGTELHWQTGRWSEHVHDVRIEEGSLLHRATGAVHAQVNSMHHQAVKDLGHGLRAVAWAPDGVVEAVEAPAARFFVGLQWHPECMQAGHMAGLVELFVKRASGLRPV